MERLLSAYKNKIENPFNTSHNLTFPDTIKAEIMDLHNNKGMGHLPRIYEGYPSFVQYLEYMIEYPLNSYNEHFIPFMYLCFPCAIEYDVLINFKTLGHDIYAVLEYLGIPIAYYPSRNVIQHSSSPTDSNMADYFRRVPKYLKNKLYEKFSKELEFYYSIHPEEEGMHLTL